MQGALPGSLQSLSRELHLSPGTTDLGSISVPIATNTTHTKMYGSTYDSEPKSPY